MSFGIFDIFKKHTNVMCGEPFIAACSRYPFLESKGGGSYPDYVFDKYGGLYWCVRVGEIDIPWGFGDGSLGFGANGSITVRRRNVNAASLDMKGITHTQLGDVSYVFVNRLTPSGREGFARHLEPRLLPIIRDIARRHGHTGFKASCAEELLRNKELAAVLDEHEMVLVSAFVRDTVEYTK